MYLDYFSLSRHPFRITPDPSLFFPGGVRGRGVVLDALIYGITSGEGILKVVGEVGSGKTMLCRMLEERLPETVEIVYLANPNLSARDIVYAIGIELKLEVDASTDRLIVMHKLQDYLLARHAEGGTVVVFIEEAQSMPLDTLEEIRLLSNLETHRHKLMQIVLFGQPELDTKLEQKSIRQLRERITHSFDLAPLTLEEIREYIHFRLQSAGCPWPSLFSPKAEKILASASGGLTRRINILADKALLAAYADPSARPQARNSAGEVLPMVLPRHVRIAIADSGYKTIAVNMSWLRYAVAALSGAAVLAVMMLGWTRFAPDSNDQVFAISDSAPAQPVQTAAISGNVERLRSEPQVPQFEIQPSAQPNAGQAELLTSAAPNQNNAVDIIRESVGQWANSPAANATASATTDARPEVELAARNTRAQLAGQTVSADQALPNQPDAQRVPVNPGRVAVSDNVNAMAQVPADSSITQATEAPNNSTVSAVSIAPAKLQSGDDTMPPGLLGTRMAPTREWLKSLSGKRGYSIQLYSVASAQTDMLEEFLEFLQLAGLLEESYLCKISANSRREEQWLVLHSDYPGLSDAKRVIEKLPVYIGQHGPYARNISGIACANSNLK